MQGEIPGFAPPFCLAEAGAERLADTTAATIAEAPDDPAA